MNLINIYNNFRTIYLFERDENGKQKITKDDSFYPFFYEPDSKGIFRGFDGTALRKVVVGSPNEVKNAKTAQSWSSDVVFVNNYLINKVDVIDKSSIKYFFIDIEVLAPDLPDPADAKYPVSCITIYNSLSKKFVTWFLGDYATEKDLLDDFVHYLQEEKPDLMLAWNIQFDYDYLHNRIKDFAKEISPISQTRFPHDTRNDKEEERNVRYPAGISILDYLGLFKKVYMREKSYTLDYVAQKHLGETTWGDSKFGVLTEEIKLKNINDVKRLVDLEAKLGLIEYYDEIRRLSKCLWEDLYYNSKIIDNLILQEAKNRNVVLPAKQKNADDETFEGAYRRADIGVYNGIYKADVASMYPNQLVNFCLSPENIVGQAEEHVIEINKIFFLQDRHAILPFIATKLIEQKDSLKKSLKAASLESEEHKLLQNKYDAYKALVNSLFGVCGLPSFRLYNNNIAGTIAYLARDLLHYVEDHLQQKGFSVIYTDTDSLFYAADADETEWLNELVDEWGKEKYGKENLDIHFESEGIFTKLLVLGKCHYYGYIESSKGTKKEIKGVEIKRANSSKYEAEFQEALINRVLDKEPKEKIVDWINSEKERIKTLPLEIIATPAKIGNKKYVNVPIFVRAFNNSTRVFPNFRPTRGELFYYIYVFYNGMRDDKGKPMNVLAFSDSQKQVIDRRYIDWEEVSRRNIVGKADAIFSAMGWNLSMAMSNQTTLF